MIQIYTGLFDRFLVHVVSCSALQICKILSGSAYKLFVPFSFSLNLLKYELWFENGWWWSDVALSMVGTTKHHVTRVWIIVTCVLWGAGSMKISLAEFANSVPVSAPGICHYCGGVLDTVTTIHSQHHILSRNICHFILSSPLNTVTQRSSPQTVCTRQYYHMILLHNMHHHKLSVLSHTYCHKTFINHTFNWPW